MDNIDVSALAAAIKAKRQVTTKGLRQAASGIGASASTLSRIERGKPPDLSTYVRLCQWLGVPMERFVVEPWDVRVRANLLAAGCDDPDNCAGACLAKAPIGAEKEV